MNKSQEQVRDFYEQFEITLCNKPTLPSRKDMDLRVALITEELEELKQATEARDIIEVADALADLLYVVYGVGITYGIDLEPIYEEVHRSNMTKIWPDGKVHRRDDGKVLKPPTFEKPNLEPILLRQGAKIRL